MLRKAGTLACTKTEQVMLSLSINQTKELRRKEMSNYLQSNKRVLLRLKGTRNKSKNLRSSTETNQLAPLLLLRYMTILNKSTKKELLVSMMKILKDTHMGVRTYRLRMILTREIRISTTLKAI